MDFELLAKYFGSEDPIAQSITGCQCRTIHGNRDSAVAAYYGQNDQTWIVTKPERLGCSLLHRADFGLAISDKSRNPNSEISNQEGHARNYLKIAIRNLIKQKAYTFINLAGLAIGIASAILIFTYVLDELSYDRYHEEADRIYRLVREIQFQNQSPLHLAGTSTAIGPTFAKELPGVEEVVRVMRIPPTPLVRYEDREFREERFYFAHASIF